MSFLPYASYADTGFEWIGKIPDHWRLVPLKQLGRIEAGQSPSSTDCNTDGIGLPFLQGCAEFGDRHPVPRQFCEVSPKIAQAGDILISVRAPVGEINIADQQYGIGRGLAAIRSISSDMSFLCYAIAASIEALQSVATGSTYQAVSAAQIGNLPIPAPAGDEQAAIAAFLDRETAKIDALVEEQRRLIVLLKEKRQAVISHAVTKGLNPDAPMKDSGVEWLGDIPTHWEVKTLKQVSAPDTSITYGIVQAGPDIPDGIPYIRTSDMSGEELPLDGYLKTSAEIDQAYARSRVVAGDLVIAIRATVGKPLIVPPELEGANLTQGTARFSPSAAISSLFAKHVLSSVGATYEFNRISKGATFKEITLEALRKFRIPLPPKAEQNEITTFVTQIDRSFGELIAAALLSETLLIERRSALISAAVTGKIDVRRPAEVLLLPVDRAQARGLVATEIIERSAHQATFGRVKLQKIAYLVEAHVGVPALEGAYLREAAGPLDREMIREMEQEAGSLAGIRVEQPDGTGSAVTYRLGDRRGTNRQDLTALLGDRAAKFDKLIEDIGTIDTKGAEAVATLYAVWNDALIDGETPEDMEIKLGVLTKWHPEKAKKFRLDDLQIWLDWMRRHGLVPTGAGPKTSTGRLFA